MGVVGTGPAELPEPMFEQVDFSGNDVHMGRFLAHMDSWYERNLMMAVHHLLRLIPSVSKVGGAADQRKRRGLVCQASRIHRYSCFNSVILSLTYDLGIY